MLHMAIILYRIIQNLNMIQLTKSPHNSKDTQLKSMKSYKKVTTTFIPPTYPAIIITNNFTAAYISELKESLEQNYISFTLQTSRKKINRPQGTPTDKNFIIVDDSGGPVLLQGEFAGLKMMRIDYPKSHNISQVIKKFDEYIGLGKLNQQINQGYYNENEANRQQNQFNQKYRMQLKDNRRENIVNGIENVGNEGFKKEGKLQFENIENVVKTNQISDKLQGNENKNTLMASQPMAVGYEQRGHIMLKSIKKYGEKVQNVALEKRILFVLLTEKQSWRYTQYIRGFRESKNKRIILIKSLSEYFRACYDEEQGENCLLLGPNIASHELYKFKNLHSVYIYGENPQICAKLVNGNIKKAAMTPTEMDEILIAEGFNKNEEKQYIFPNKLNEQKISQDYRQYKRILSNKKANSKSLFIRFVDFMKSKQKIKGTDPQKRKTKKISTKVKNQESNSSSERQGKNDNEYDLGNKSKRSIKKVKNKVNNLKPGEVVYEQKQPVSLGDVLKQNEEKKKLENKEQNHKSKEYFSYAYPMGRKVKKLKTHEPNQDRPHNKSLDSSIKALGLMPYNQYYGNQTKIGQPQLGNLQIDSVLRQRNTKKAIEQASIKKLQAIKPQQSEEISQINKRNSDNEIQFIRQNHDGTHKSADKMNKELASAQIIMNNNLQQAGNENVPKQQKLSFLQPQQDNKVSSLAYDGSSSQDLIKVSKLNSKPQFFVDGTADKLLTFKNANKSNQKQYKQDQKMGQILQISKEFHEIRKSQLILIQPVEYIEEILELANIQAKKQALNVPVSIYSVEKDEEIQNQIGNNYVLSNSERNNKSPLPENQSKDNVNKFYSVSNDKNRATPISFAVNNPRKYSNLNPNPAFLSTYATDPFQPKHQIQNQFTSPHRFQLPIDQNLYEKSIENGITVYRFKKNLLPLGLNTFNYQYNSLNTPQIIKNKITSPQSKTNENHQAPTHTFHASSYPISSFFTKKPTKQTASTESFYSKQNQQKSPLLKPPAFSTYEYFASRGELPPKSKNSDKLLAKRYKNSYNIQQNQPNDPQIYSSSSNYKYKQKKYPQNDQDRSDKFKSKQNSEKGKKKSNYNEQKHENKNRDYFNDNWREMKKQKQLYLDSLDSDFSSQKSHQKKYSLSRSRNKSRSSSTSIIRVHKQENPHKNYTVLYLVHSSLPPKLMKQIFDISDSRDTIQTYSQSEKIPQILCKAEFIFDFILLIDQNKNSFNMNRDRIMKGLYMVNYQPETPQTLVNNRIIVLKRIQDLEKILNQMWNIKNIIKNSKTHEKSGEVGHIYYKDFNKSIRYMTKLLKKQFPSAQIRKYFSIVDLPTKLPKINNQITIILLDQVSFNQTIKYCEEQERQNPSLFKICIPKSAQSMKICKNQPGTEKMVWLIQKELDDPNFLMRRISKAILK